MWQTIRLGDVCTISSSKRIFAKEYQTEGIPFYRGKEVIEKHNGNKVSTELFISPKRYEEIKGKYEVPKKGDILLTSVGTLGIPWLVDEDDFYFKDGNLTWLRCNTQILPSYLYLWLNSAEAQNQIDVKCIGSTQKALTIETLNKFQITLPSLELQKKIVAVINPIESRININRSVNENLEQQAGALYQSFFSPKSGTQGEVVTLDAYCSIFTGKKNANASVEGGKYKFFTCAPDALQIDSYIFDGNAIIVSGNGAYTGRTRFYSGRFDLYQRTYACTLFENINPDYIFPLYWFVKLELSKKIMGGTRGSAIPYIVMNDLAKFEFIYNEETFTTYMPIFKSLTESIQANEFENECLAEIRDALLPRLMSGELDVSNIQI